MPNLLSYFWTPLTALGSHAADGRMNAQISLSVFGAGITPDRPRLLVVSFKHNYTHDLIAESGSATVSLLAKGQELLLDTLGLHSGRDRDKLAGLDVIRTSAGNPALAGSLGYLDCRVITSFDLGDATAFLCAVEDNVSLAEGEPLIWQEVRPTMTEEWLKRWDAKIAADIERARATMRW